MLLAILEKRLGLNIYQQDVFLKCLGGLKVSYPGLYLAVVSAVVSSYFDRPLAQGICCAGRTSPESPISPAQQMP